MVWSAHITEITNKARRKIGLIYRHFYTMSSPKSLLQLYTSLVRPQLEYASQVWNPFLTKDTHRLESIRLKMCCKNWNSSYSENLQQTSLPELLSRRSCLSLSYFYNLINGNFDFPNIPTRVREPV